MKISFDKYLPLPPFQLEMSKDIGFWEFQFEIKKLMPLVFVIIMVVFWAIKYICTRASHSSHWTLSPHSSTIDRVLKLFFKFWKSPWTFFQIITCSFLRGNKEKGILTKIYNSLIPVQLLALHECRLLNTDFYYVLC